MSTPGQLNINFTSTEGLKSVPTKGGGPGSLYAGLRSGTQAFVGSTSKTYVLKEASETVDGVTVLRTRDDPARQWVALGEGGGGGSVASVTGSGVDDADPANPIIEPHVLTLEGENPGLVGGTAENPIVLQQSIVGLIPSVSETGLDATTLQTINPFQDKRCAYYQDAAIMIAAKEVRLGLTGKPAGTGTNYPYGFQVAVYIMGTAAFDFTVANEAGGSAFVFPAETMVAPNVGRYVEYYFNPGSVHFDKFGKWQYVKAI